MKRVCLGFFGALFMLAPSGALAVSCSTVSYSELLESLQKSGFPRALLNKVHVDEAELRAQGAFIDCPPNPVEGETAYIYAWRPVDDFTKGLEVSFTFFEFPTTKARDTMLKKLVAADELEQTAIKANSHEANKLESDVYYFVDPESTKAIRVERDVQYLLE